MSEGAHFLGAVPQAIEVAANLYATEHVFEGGGAAIFLLSPDTAAQIMAQGLEFFAAANQGRGHAANPYYAYENWRESPMPPELIHGADSAALPRWFLRMAGAQQATFTRFLQQTMEEGGAYYTRAVRSNLGLIVIPDKRLLVVGVPP